MTTSGEAKVNRYRAPARRITRLAATFDRKNRSRLPRALATPEPLLEVGNLRCGAKPDPQQGLRRQQRDVIAGGRN
jgi:hypothetical protein